VPGRTYIHARGLARNVESRPERFNLAAHGGLRPA
jgi:hypothetical protein